MGLTKSLVHGTVEFVKNWPPLGWIAYISLGISSSLTALNTAAKEGTALSTWLPSFLKIYILGYGPLIFFLIATTLFIIELRRKKTVILVDRPIPVPVSPLPQFLPIQQKKFYSERNKSDLANAFTDLLELLNRDGFKIIQKVQKIIEQWRPPGIIDIIGRKEPDIAVEIDKLNEIGNLAATLYRDLFEENGFLSKYNAYHDELCQILQIRDKPSTTSNQPLIELQSGINFFKYANPNKSC